MNVDDLQDTVNEQVKSKTSDLVDQFDKEFGDLIDGKINPLMPNLEYAALSAALLISVNRQLARIAAAFGDSQQIDHQVVAEMVVSQFSKNFSMACGALVKQVNITSRETH